MIIRFKNEVCKLRLKIYNPDLVDCSSSVNMLMPSPESMGMIVNLFWEIIKSNAVESILSHSFKLEFDSGVFVLISPEGRTHGSLNIHMEGIYPLKNLNLRSSDADRENKIYGCFIESIESVFKRDNFEERVDYYDQISQILVNEAGLRGVKKGIALIQAILGSAYRLIPKIIQEQELLNFELNARIIWKAWSSYYEIPGIGHVQCGEIDHISASTNNMEFYLGDLCLGGHNGRSEGDKHFADIQKAINNVYPKYTIKEVGDSSSEIDGRIALYNKSLAEERFNLEPKGILFGKPINQEEKVNLLNIFSDSKFHPYCIKLHDNHVISLTIDNPEVDSLFSYLRELHYLTDLIINNLPPIEKLDFKTLKSLKSLILRNCHEVHAITDSLAGLETIKILHSNRITSLPKTFGKLTHLKRIEVIGCERLNSFPIEMRELNISTLKVIYSPLLTEANINNNIEKCKNYFNKFFSKKR